MLNWLKALWARIDLHNLAQWGHTAASAGVAVAGAIVANQTLPAGSKGYAVASLITLAAAAVAKQSANPGTWPQTPVLADVESAASDVATIAPGTKAAAVAGAIAQLAPVLSQVAANTGDSHAALIAAATTPQGAAVEKQVHDVALQTLTAMTDAAHALNTMAANVAAVVAAPATAPSAPAKA